MTKDKTCSCEIGGKKISGLPIIKQNKDIKQNKETVIVLYKGSQIKRHREKHNVKIK